MSKIFDKYTRIIKGLANYLATILILTVRFKQPVRVVRANEFVCL